MIRRDAVLLLAWSVLAQAASAQGAERAEDRAAVADAARNTHFVSARATLTNIAVTDRLFLRFAPQVYYLRSDDTDGFYLNSGLTLASRELPFSISMTANEPMRTRVLGGEEFIWNLSLQYALR